MTEQKAFNIQDWASDKIYRRGLAYYRNDCVTSFEMDDDDNIFAEVEGSEIYAVDISWNRSGGPHAECSCPYNWEPLCKHAVAALLYWKNGGEFADPAKENAKERASKERDATADQCYDNYSFDRACHINDLAILETKKRHSTTLLDAIKITEKSQNGCLCGLYKVSSGTYDHDYSVLVRNVCDPSQTTCNCPDYLINELGTCKHIELVNGHIVAKAKKVPKSSKDFGIWISIKPLNSFKSAISKFEEIHIHSSDADINGRLFSGSALELSLWNKDGYFIAAPSATLFQDRLSAVLGKIRGLFSSSKIPEVFVTDEVKALISKIDESMAWKSKIDKIIALPDSSKEWTDFKKAFPMKLYGYQEEGVLFAVRNMRVFLGDDMGLGKTIQAIAAALFLKRIAGVKKVLIFAPTSLKYQWKREIEKVSGEEAMIVSGNKIKRNDIYENSNATFLIVNYELIFRDWDHLRKMASDMVILDEAQRIKNWETKTAKEIKRLGSRFAMVLTGTPFENRLLELHSLCEFLHPRALGPMWRLMPTYANLDEHEKVVGYSGLAELRQKLSPFFIRRERSTVVNQLPEKVFNEYLTEISSVQRKHHDDYQATLAQLLGRMKRRPLSQQEMLHVFACLSAMRIISNAYAQHDWEKYRREVEVSAPLSLAQIKNFHSPKLLEFRSVMEELLEKPDAKFVIFSQWERMLKLASVTIKDLLQKNGAESVIFSGSLPPSQRPKVIDRFISDPSLRIFFSTDAGGVGLNLQEAASFVINLELPWNPGVLEQRISRVHRLGQKNTVNVINFISTDCIEERVYEAVRNKRVLFDGVFDGKTDSINFDKENEFISRLTEMVGDDSDAAATDINLPIIESIAPRVAFPGQETAILSPAEEKTIDLSGIVKLLGAWVGNSSLAGINPDTLKVKVEKTGDEIKLSINKPPKELISGIKDMFASLFGSL